MAHGDIHTCTYWVCIDCRMAKETGAVGEDAETPMEQTWSLIETGQTVTAGLMREEHACGIEIGEDVEECECDLDDFSKTPCDGCGQYLAGQRFGYTVWSPED